MPKKLPRWKKPDPAIFPDLKKIARTWGCRFQKKLVKDIEVGKYRIVAHFDPIPKPNIIRIIYDYSISEEEFLFIFFHELAHKFISMLSCISGRYKMKMEEKMADEYGYQLYKLYFPKRKIKKSNCHSDKSSLNEVIVINTYIESKL